ncbi:hypothetical protein [Candidatus Poriferisocius sp.]|uniref:hypothetical protein n=1 Tax=Candidatus Poriferisocius sp. TaxID=3101276 RepID=UPI003B01F025
MNAGLAIPALIILGCGLLVGAVAFATRRKRAPWDIFPGPIPEVEPKIPSIRADGSNDNAGSPAGEDHLDGGTSSERAKPEPELVDDDAAAAAPFGVDTSRTGPEDLAGWHRLHELTVSAWIENHQKVLGRINASGLRIDLENRDKLMVGYEELAPRMREAIAGHPSPVMRAELSAMHVAGEATVFAVVRSDYETARRQHLIYIQYRDEWIERLRQFSENPTGSLRAVLTTTEFELEEIRAALEAALIETENPAEDGDDREIPLIIGEDPAPILNLEDQPEHVLKAAMGSPEDSTDDLEGGRLRYLLRRVSTRISTRGTSENEPPDAPDAVGNAGQE